MSIFHCLHHCFADDKLRRTETLKDIATTCFVGSSGQGYVWSNIVGVMGVVRLKQLWAQKVLDRLGMCEVRMAKTVAE